MVGLFNTVLDMSINAGIVILAVILVRAFLFKAPKRFSYLLWAVVGFRLVCPISIKSIVSIFGFGRINSPTLPNVGGDIIVNASDKVKPIYPVDDPNFVINGGASVEFAEKFDAIALINTAIMIIWFSGMAIALLYTAVSYFKVKRQMANAIRFEDNVYMSEKVGSPFALGFIRPKIYIPYGIDQSTYEQIIAHERCHIKRGDHIIKPTAFLILAVHWFNPLCWLAFRLMCLDMEMSCDEKVLKHKGDELMKKNYARALLSFATDKRLPAPSPIAFSESKGNAKRRIKHALYWKRPKFIINLICIVLCVATLVACGADASNPEWKDVRTETFGENPYNFVFASNGDGTCYIKEIRVDKDYSGDIHLVIPEKAPNGDTVVEVRNVYGLNGSDTIQNVPVYLTFERMSAIVSKIENASEVTTTEKHGFTVGQNRERDAKTFKAFYGEKISDNGIGYYELEPFIDFNEKDRLATILDVYAYSEEDCYNDTVIFLDSLAGEKEDKSVQAREAFKYLYHVGDRITEITFPATVKKIGYGAFDGCDNLGKVNGISDGCVLGVQKSDSFDASVVITEIVINGTEKEKLFSYEASLDANADLINALD
jgi:beta-lactamase regulating signal transducer with metallopeptidase domain